MSRRGTFASMARSLRRDRGPKIIDIDARRAALAENAARKFVAATLERDPSRETLISSTAFRRVAVAAFCAEPKRKASCRLFSILNVLTDYSKSEAIEAVSLQAMARRLPEAADMIERAAVLLHKSEGMNRPIRSPGAGWKDDLFDPGRIAALAKDGGLIFALRCLVHSLRAADFNPPSSIPGVSLGHLAARGPGLMRDPQKALAGYMARSLYATLPAGVADPNSTICELLRHVGINTTRQSVAKMAKAREK